jgi:phosphate ABC transporter phosphate-binding protein
MGMRGIRTPALLLLALFGLAPRLCGQSATAFAPVKKVYVEPFASDDGARLRQSLMQRFKKTGQYQVVSAAGEADAVIKGSGEIWVRGYLTVNPRAPSMNRQTVYGGFLSVAVVGKNQKALWSYLVTPDKLIWTNIADDLAGKMLKAMVAARESELASAGPGSTVRLDQTALRGAGATFPAPLYQKWFQSFRELHPHVELTYQAVGSAKGLEMLREREVDFAGSDASSPDGGDAKLGTGYWRIPVVLGAVVPIYNLPGLAQDLRFTPEMLAGIFLGKITRWNDPEIRRWNSGVNLPDANIIVVHRSDGSGTTYSLSDYLSRVSPEWKASSGTGLAVAWNTGVGAEGNQGVASTVNKTANSLGYVELVYAIQQELPYGSVRNSSGVFLHADLRSVAEAAKQVSGLQNGPIPSITNSPGKGAYPIATFTWLLFRDDLPHDAQRSALLELVRWMLSDGQKECAALAYTPLPSAIAEQQLEFLNSLR